MESVVLVLHYFVCAFLIVVILLQAGKGADIGAAFGGASQTVFGSRGAATFLSKLTTVVAIVFLVTSISLASFSRHRSKSIMQSQGKATETLPTPAAPGLTPPAASPAPAVMKPAATPAASPQPAATPAPK